MPSPVPKHLRTAAEAELIEPRFRDHMTDLVVRPPKKLPPVRHPAKYQPGLATALVELARSDSVGDPMAGSGRLVEETERPFRLNEIDPKYRPRLERLDAEYGSLSTFGDARALPWACEVMVFSPPYYPKTDRRRACGHDDAKRGPVVGFRDSYGAGGIEGFVGEPGGVDAILAYRDAMRAVYTRLAACSDRMILVTKNWTRQGVELRLDWDTVLTAAEAGWTVTGRHGWVPPASLWSRFNQKRNTGVTVEDVLVFARSPRAV